ncbi:hypothetical protein F5Y12DRAFT_792037 [Xylaria sp. FL1777]|nr:hypothetical protein F5Y12DRAFT_792037 [Xylaria sp. FL1777]
MGKAWRGMRGIVRWIPGIGMKRKYSEIHCSVVNGQPNDETSDNDQLSVSIKRQATNGRAAYDELLKEHENLKIEHERLQSITPTLPRGRLILKPYRTNYTQSDAQKGFEDLMRNIIVWVEDWSDRFIIEEDFTEHWLDSLKHFPQVVNPFRQWLHLDSNQDLLSAVGYPDSDQDIVSACIVRFVQQRIFQAPSTISPDTAKLLKDIEQTMPQCTAPKLDLCAIHTWRAQACHALFSHPGYSEARQASIDTLTGELAQILDFICKPSKRPEFIPSISSKIIQPSFSLSENLRKSHEEYYFETAPWVKPDALMSSGLPDGRLQELLGNFYCVNSAKSKAILIAEKLDPRPTAEELQRQLYFICSIQPALKVRELQRSGGKELVTISKQKVLVAWDPDRLQGDPRILKEETWLSRVCSI